MGVGRKVGQEGGLGLGLLRVSKGGFSRCRRSVQVLQEGRGAVRVGGAGQSGGGGSNLTLYLLARAVLGVVARKH